MTENTHAHSTSNSRNRALKSTAKYDSKDILHDSFLEPYSQELIALAESIFFQVEALRPPSRRKPRADAMERKRSALLNLMANLMRLYQGGASGSLIMALRNKPTSRYDRKDFSRDTLREMMRGLVAIGYVSLREARIKERSTTIKPTAKLEAMLEALPSGKHIKAAHGAETVILKAFTKRRAPKLLIDYEDTAETGKMREEMETINAFLATSEIRLDGQRHFMGYLTRRFQIESPEASHSFDRVGRLFGGSWQTLKKDSRHLLTIEGEDIVDLDYKSMFAMLAYHRAGASWPLSDPYSGIDGLTREQVKLSLLSLLSRSQAMKRIPEAFEAELYARGWNGPKLQAAISERHPEIASLFCKGIGLELMKLESDILVSCLLELCQKSIVALPLHDGIHVAQSHREAAMSAMKDASMRLLGQELHVVEKPIFRPSLTPPLRT